ncbi:hypothetical protein GMOD_00005282 [Pyrenophora seminiperda CCB06]|uniref:Uncharacterized protein n=1 Tax=Pyrenophora seminiperda CCB06 TaxID=1302712 RepID=A0A3M7LVM9_9PLEO|nr:hypothetical protein GMOD_00005282 [Pyrenophora seminiperda CCB06]
MGIPIGWNIIRRDDAKDRDVLRDDVTGHRSPIRRRARPNRSPRPSSSLDTDFIAPLSASPRDLQLVPRPSHRSRLAPPPVPEVSRTDYRTHDATREPPTLRRAESSLRRSRDHLDGYMRAWETRAAMDSEPPPPAFTPAFAPAFASRTPEPELLRDARDPSFMLARAAYRHAMGARLTRSRSPRADPSPARGDTANPLEQGADSSGDNTAGFPPLRRMGRRTIAHGPLPASSLRESWSPVPALDGLGDRNRSVSPFGDTPLWDSFLTTVVDDPVAPTAASSFASAAASASFSNSHPSSRAGSSNSAASSQTHVTVPSRRQSLPHNEHFMRACDTSEDDTASDTDEEETDVRASIQRRNATEALRNRLGASDSAPPRRRIRASYFSNEPPVRDTERYSLRVIDRSRDASAYVRSFYSESAWREVEVQETPRPPISQLDGPIEEPINTHEEEAHPLVPVDAAPLDQELRDARSLLERLSRREDISDDFWASVGLTRSFADPIERFQELERL